MKKFIVCVLFCLLMYGNHITAQTSDPNLELEVRETINQQCIHKVKAFTDHLAKIARKEEADSIKDYHIEACLDLFIGGGNDVKDNDGNVIFPAPMIEVSSLSTGSINPYYIKNYLVRLKEVQYTKVVFKNSSCYLAEGGIKKIGENRYSAAVSFYQVFVGYQDNWIVYRDKTKKTVQVFIERDNLGRFDVLLGDIKVEQTTATYEE